MKGNNIIKSLIPFLILAIISIPVSALEFYTTSTLETVQTTGSGNTWTTPVAFSLNLTESRTMYGVTVNYADIGNSNTLALFRITGGTTTDAALAKNAGVCIKGTCQMNGTIPVNSGDIRMTLIDIVQKSSGTATTNISTGMATSDNVVTVYLKCSSGENLNLNRNGVNTYDPSMCSAKSGWSNSADKELTLYIHRNFNIPTSISVVSTGNYNEKDLLDNGNTRPYILTSNDKYMFSVKTKRTDAWGGDIEEIGTYTLTVKGLSGTSTAASTRIRGKREVTLPKTITLDMGEAVTFKPVSGAEVTNKGGTNYEFDFRAPGNYKMEFTKANGLEDYEEFVATEPEKQSAAVTPAAPVVQKSADDTNNYLLGAGLVGGVLLLGIVISKRKPKGERMHANPLKQG